MLSAEIDQWVRGKMFAQVSLTMGGDMNLLQTLKGAHTDSRCCVEVEHEEGARDWEEGALIESAESVRDCAHRI
jgi:hypothetical protein